MIKLWLCQVQKKKSVKKIVITWPILKIMSKKFSLDASKAPQKLLYRLWRVKGVPCGIGFKLKNFPQDSGTCIMLSLDLHHAIWNQHQAIPRPASLHLDMTHFWHNFSMSSHKIGYMGRLQKKKLQTGAFGST